MCPGGAEASATSREIKELLAGSPLLLAHRVIGPFLEAYSVVADRLVTRETAAPLDSDGLIAESLGVAHSMILTPDTVQVRVLSPVLTADWTGENLDEQVALLMKMYVDTFGLRDVRLAGRRLLRPHARANQLAECQAMIRSAAAWGSG